jgi:valyl-tRNA synthetase
VLARLTQVIREATAAFEQYEYAVAREKIEEFFWKDWCDNYLELCKARAYGERGDSKAQTSAFYTLWHGTEALLRLFAPFLPHVTEELYSHLFDESFAAKQSIHAQGQWPKAEDYAEDANAIAAGNQAVAVLAAVRKLKADRSLSVKYPLDRLLLAGSTAALEPYLEDVLAAANAKTWEKSSPADGMVDADGSGLQVGAEFAAQADVA